MDVDRIKVEYDKVKSALTVVAPFISSLLSRVRIVVSDSIGTACVTKDGVMIISPTFWRLLSWAGKAWILAHETMHIAFRDHKRMGDRDWAAWNVTCDAVNNEMIKDMLKVPAELEDRMIFQGSLYRLLKPKVDYDDFMRLCKEELYKMMPKACATAPVCASCSSDAIEPTAVNVKDGYVEGKCRECGREWRASTSLRGERTPSTPITSVEVDVARHVADAEGHVLQEGDPEIYQGGAEASDADEKWKAAIARAYEIQRSIGRIPLSLERLVKKILESKVDWRALLRNSIKVGIGRFVVSTWKRPSRKSDEYPGLRKFSNPTVWCLIDTSGSISDKELEQFLGEVYAVAGEAPVAVVCWDAKAYEVIKARSRQEVITNVSSKVKGGGGTVIKPALRKLLDNMKSRDAVIIFSDFFIDDLESGEVKQLLSEVAQRASVAIACSVHREVQIDGWRFVKLEL